MEFPINDNIKVLLNTKLAELEAYLNADVLSFYGPIVDGTEQGKRIIDSAKRKADIFRFLNRVSVCCLL